jgi:hypothetical protein
MSLRFNVNQRDCREQFSMLGSLHSVFSAVDINRDSTAALSEAIRSGILRGPSRIGGVK